MLKLIEKIVKAWDVKIDNLAESYGRRVRNASQFTKSLKGALEADLRRRAQNSSFDFGKTTCIFRDAVLSYFAMLGMAIAALLLIVCVVGAFGIPTWFYAF